jgi:uncharacterized protein
MRTGAGNTRATMSILDSLMRAAGSAGEALITPLGGVVDEIPGQRGALSRCEHRPWPLPERPWLMGQTWYDLLFAHWPVAPEALRAHVPAPLELDVREGLAWIGVTPFVIGGLRIRGMPPLPRVSHFPELNVRTYATYAGRPGIYFLSLDAARMSAVLAARAAYKLPYFHAEMAARRAGDRRIDYRSRRKNCDGSVEFAASYGPAGPRLDVREGSLERWLAERYCLYVVAERGRPLRGDIHHPPWPLQAADAEITRNTMAMPLDVALDADPLLHYSARQDTLIWSLEEA